MHRFEIQQRFCDTDAKGHLNNAVFASYTEVSRLTFLKTLGVPTESLILAHLSIDYLRQVRWGDDVCVVSSVEAIGRSSITLRQHVMASEMLAASVKAIVVHFNFALQQSEAIPQAMRNALVMSMDQALAATASNAEGTN